MRDRLRRVAVAVLLAVVCVLSGDAASWASPTVTATVTEPGPTTTVTESVEAPAAWDESSVSGAGLALALLVFLAAAGFAGSFARGSKA